MDYMPTLHDYTKLLTRTARIGLVPGGLPVDDAWGVANTGGCEAHNKMFRKKKSSARKKSSAGLRAWLCRSVAWGESAPGRMWIHCGGPVRSSQS